MMFVKNLKSFSLCLSLSTVLYSCLYASEGEDNFGGFQRGFLTPKTKPAPKVKSTRTPQIQKEIVLQNTQIVPHQTNNTYSSALELFQKQLDLEDFSEPSAMESLWRHPCFSNSESRQQIYDVLDIPGAWVEVEKHFSNLEKGQLKTTCESREFFRDVLKFWGFFNNVYSHRRSALPLPKEPELLPFIMQNLVHWVVQSKFDYMNSLSSQNQTKFKQQFITPESDLEKGEFILFGTGWDTPTGLPEKRIRYFQQTLSNTHKIYRICDQGFTNSQWVPIKENVHFQYYGKGEITYRSWYPTDNSFYLSQSGFILDNDLKLVENEGFVFTKATGGLNPYRFSIYERHGMLDEMFFFHKAEFDAKTVPPLLNSLLNSVGGVKQLEAKEFLFIPKPIRDEDTAVSPSAAKLLLPYLYELKEGALQDPLAIGWLDETIQELKTILVEDMCAQENKALDQEIAFEIAGEEVKQEIESANPELLNRIEQAKQLIQEPENTKAKQRKRLRAKAKKKVVKQVKAEKVQAMDPELVRQRRKERALAKIEQEYTEKAAQQRNFSTSEAQELLGEMVEKLSAIGIEKTGEVQVQGSHMAIQVVDKDSENSTRLGIATRSQKRGYQSGTVKHIIKDMIQKVTLIVKK